MKKRKPSTSFYITQDLRDLVSFLRKREEMTKVVFYRKAIRIFFAGDQKIDPRIMITERSDPEYIRRDVLETMTFDSVQREQIKDLAAKRNCNEGQIIFQAVLNYCAMLLSIDSTGVRFEE